MLQTTRTSSNDSQLIYLKLCYSELRYHTVSNCTLKTEVTDSSESMVTIYDCIQCHENEPIQIFTATKISKFPTQKSINQCHYQSSSKFRPNINTKACHELLLTATYMSASSRFLYLLVDFVTSNGIFHASQVSFHLMIISIQHKKYPTSSNTSAIATFSILPLQINYTECCNQS